LAKPALEKTGSLPLAFQLPSPWRIGRAPAGAPLIFQADWFCFGGPRSRTGWRHASCDLRDEPLTLVERELVRIDRKCGSREQKSASGNRQYLDMPLCAYDGMRFVIRQSKIRSTNGFLLAKIGPI
jgi:hypothetical protein